jgi:hypothetical protein
MPRPTKICASLPAVIALVLACGPAAANSLSDMRDQAYALEAKGDCANAYPIFLAAAAKSGGAAEDNLAAANCAVDLKRTKDAIAELHLALAKRAQLSNQERVEALETLAYQLEDAGDNTAAANAWDDALKEADTGEIRLGSARAWRAAGNTARADQMLASIDPGALTPSLQAEYWTEKSERLAETDPQAALDAINRAIALEDADYRRVDRAGVLTKLGHTQEAVADLETAHKQSPDDATTDLALAYAYYDAHRFADATALFDAAARADGKHREYVEDWGYALVDAGHKKDAVVKFREGIDAKEAQADADPASREQIEQELWDIRQQVQEIDRDFSFSAYFNYRSDHVITTPLLTGASLLQSGLGAELDWQTPYGIARSDDLSLFAGTFMSFKNGEAVPDSRSTQGAIGVRWKPFEETDLSLSFGRYIKLGSNADDAWFVNTGYSAGNGTDWNPTAKSWNYFRLESDATYLLDGPQLFSATAEARFGRAYNVGDLWALIPHAVVAGQAEYGNGVHSYLLEAGGGFAVRHWFCADRYEGPLCAAELTMQYRYPLASDGLGKDSGAFVAGITFDR